MYDIVYISYCRCDWLACLNILTRELLILCFSGLMEILPDRCTMIAKKELTYAGTVGLICWLGGIVFINRKKTSDAKSVMADAAKTMLDEQVICLLSTQDAVQWFLWVFFFVFALISRFTSFWLWLIGDDVRWFFSVLCFHLYRFACGCSQRERETRKVTCCPSKKALSTWQCRHK